MVNHSQVGIGRSETHPGWWSITPLSLSSVEPTCRASTTTTYDDMNKKKPQPSTLGGVDHFRDSMAWVLTNVVCVLSVKISPTFSRKHHLLNLHWSVLSAPTLWRNDQTCLTWKVCKALLEYLNNNLPIPVLIVGRIFLPNVLMITRRLLKNINSWLQAITSTGILNWTISTKKGSFLRLYKMSYFVLECATL